MKREPANKSGGESVSERPPVEVIIETPKGSRNKLKYDPANRMYKLSKILALGMFFPFDFGSVPGTKADDGDPLDVLVLTDEPLFPGCLVDTVLVGAIELEQEEGGKTTRNDRLVAVAQASLLYSETKEIADLNPVILKQIEAFFVNYQKARGVKVNILGHVGSDKAFEILRRSRRKQ